MTDLIAAFAGLLGTLIGSLITLRISRKESEKQLRQQMAIQEQDILDTQIEQKIKYINGLYEMQELCAQIDAWLRRILSFSCIESIQSYEESGVYPVIATDFLENPKAAHLTSSHSALLSSLYVRLSIYNELKQDGIANKQRIHAILGDIYNCALEAQSECFTNLNVSATQIPQLEKEILTMKIDKLKRYETRMLEGKHTEKRKIGKNIEPRTLPDR